jgi:uncharacterized membrane protein (DUF106 family)
MPTSVDPSTFSSVPVVTIVIGVIITTIVSIAIQAFWNWFINKNGKNDIEELKEKNRAIELSLTTKYVDKESFEKLEDKVQEIREKAFFTNKNNIDMVKDSARQNLDRMQRLEEKLDRLPHSGD